MSSTYTFKWPSGPQEVILTGTFDNWSKTLYLVKQPDQSFELTVPLPDDQGDILYKYIVDGEWCVSPTERIAWDESSIENNVVSPTDLVTADFKGSFIPESGGLGTTTILVPKENFVETTVLPSTEGKHSTLYGEPGIVVPQDKEEMAVFNEVSAVDPNELNAQINAEEKKKLKQKQKLKKKVKKIQYKAKKKKKAAELPALVGVEGGAAISAASGAASNDVSGVSPVETTEEIEVEQTPEPFVENNEVNPFIQTLDPKACDVSTGTGAISNLDNECSTKVNEIARDTSVDKRTDDVFAERSYLDIADKAILTPGISREDVSETTIPTAKEELDTYKIAVPIEDSSFPNETKEDLDASGIAAPIADSSFAKEAKEDGPVVGYGAPVSQAPVSSDAHVEPVLAVTSKAAEVGTTAVKVEPVLPVAAETGAFGVTNANAEPEFPATTKDDVAESLNMNGEPTLPVPVTGDAVYLNGTPENDGVKDLNQAKADITGEAKADKGDDVTTTAVVGKDAGEAKTAMGDDVTTAVVLGKEAERTRVSEDAGEVGVSREVDGAKEVDASPVTNREDKTRPYESDDEIVIAQVAGSSQNVEEALRAQENGDVIVEEIKLSDAEKARLTQEANLTNVENSPTVSKTTAKVPSPNARKKVAKADEPKKKKGFFTKFKKIFK